VRSAVVICSVETDLEIVEAARAAGALGYVFKIRLTEDLPVAVRSVAGANPLCLPADILFSASAIPDVSEVLPLI
jgi:DNA-binding NarL/FixJ family response regulator